MSKLRSIFPTLVFLGVLFSSGAAHAGQAPTVEFLNSGKVLPKNLPFSEAVRVGETVYLSGRSVSCRDR